MGLGACSDCDTRNQARTGSGEEMMPRFTEDWPRNQRAAEAYIILQGKGNVEKGEPK